MQITLQSEVRVHKGHQSRIPYRWSVSYTCVEATVYLNICHKLIQPFDELTALTK